MEGTNVQTTFGGAQVGKRISASQVIVGVLVILVLALAAGSAWIYSGEERVIADLRQANATLSSQLDQSRQEAKATQTDLEGVREQLAGSQAETAEAQAAGRVLGEKLAESQQQTQQAEAREKVLQAEKADLGVQVAIQRDVAQAAQAKNASLSQKMARATARAQLVDEFISIGLSRENGEDKAARTLNWLSHLAALNDPTIDKYMTAFTKNPRDATPLNQMVAYLAGSVVTELK